MADWPGYVQCGPASRSGSHRDQSGRIAAVRMFADGFDGGPAAKPALRFEPRSFIRQALCAEKVPLADIDAVVAQQVVGGDVMEEEIRDRPDLQERESLELHRAVAQ